MQDLKKEAGIGKDSPFLTLCPGCGGKTYCYTNTHGKCEECHQLVTYEQLVEANAVFLKAQMMLKDMIETPLPLNNLAYNKMPFLTVMKKDD